MDKACPPGRIVTVGRGAAYPDLAARFGERGIDLWLISGVSGQGLDRLRERLSAFAKVADPP